MTYKLDITDLVRLKRYAIEIAKQKPGLDLREVSRLAHREWIRWKIRNDLFFFGSEFLGWKNSTDKTGKRHRVDNVFHRWLCKIITQQGDKLIIVPRFHLKTTWVKLRIVQLILRDPNVRIGLFSATARLTTQQMKWIRRLFMNPKLADLFPEVIPTIDWRKWEKVTDEELTIFRDPNLEHPSDAPQLIALGAGAEITGLHLDYAFCDDIVTKKNVRTQSQLEEVEDWWELLYPILEVDSEKCVTGTPYFYRDLYSRIREKKEIPAKSTYVRSYKEHGKIIYSSWFRDADFEKIRRGMKAYMFSCNFECNPIPDEDRVFPPPQPTFRMPLPADVYGYRYYCLVDPAATTEDYSDCTGVSLLAVNRINQVFVIESHSFKKKSEDLADFLISRHLRYGFKRVGIELGLQAHFETVLKLRLENYMRQSRRKIKMIVIPIPIKKTDKGTRIDTMIGGLVRTGRILINENLTNLIAQMDNFTGRKGDEDDEIDALSMAPYVIESFAAHQNIPEEMRAVGMTWQDFHKQGERNGWNGRFKAA